jgi:uncharacterized protein YjbI with pentapeptide repeats
MHEVDFSETNLSCAKFTNCDLLNAVFDRTNLLSAHLSTAENYNIDPTNNTIKNATFSYPGIIGLLKNFQVKIVN